MPMQGSARRGLKDENQRHAQLQFVALPRLAVASYTWVSIAIAHCPRHKEAENLRTLRVMIA